MVTLGLVPLVFTKNAWPGCIYWLILTAPDKGAIKIPFSMSVTVTYPPCAFRFGSHAQMVLETALFVTVFQSTADA